MKEEKEGRNGPWKLLCVVKKRRNPPAKIATWIPFSCLIWLLSLDATFKKKDTRGGDTPFRLTNWAPFKLHLLRNKMQKNTEDSLEQSKPLKRFLLWEDCKANTRNAVAAVQIEKRATIFGKKATRQIQDVCFFLI